MSLALLTKDPNARLDYGFDWTGFLKGKTITASSWVIPAGLINEGEALSSTVATVILSGGVLAKQYEITNRITASDGTIDQRSLSILIQKK
jgi:hypothetical protein